VRITSETMVMRSLERLQTRLSSFERAQSELATGKRILQPSDDPSGARRAMSLRSALAAREQELSNAQDARGWLETADSQLQSALQRLARARELATRGATSSGPSERAALALEVRQIAQEIEGIANARHLDRPVFGGFTGGKAVEWVEGSDDPDAPTAGHWTTNGDGDEVKRRVSDTEHVRVNVTASEWLGFASADGDLLSLLGGLADDLENGTAADVGARLDGLKRASHTIADSLGAIGAATNRVDSARARAEDLSLTLRTELSDVEDVDIARGVMELQLNEVAYEATLQALGRALPPSLVAFLR
jgi:flagellar hook-associated protein 3 FlgL